MTEIDKWGELVELIPGKISSAKEEEQWKSEDGNQKCPEQKSSKESTEGKNVESETPFLTQVLLQLLGYQTTEWKGIQCRFKPHHLRHWGNQSGAGKMV